MKFGRSTDPTTAFIPALNTFKSQASPSSEPTNSATSSDMSAVTCFTPLFLGFQSLSLCNSSFLYWVVFLIDYNTTKFIPKGPGITANINTWGGLSVGNHVQHIVTVLGIGSDLDAYKAP
jgi:hypothetical protein